MRPNQVGNSTNQCNENNRVNHMNNNTCKKSETEGVDWMSVSSYTGDIQNVDLQSVKKGYDWKYTYINYKTVLINVYSVTCLIRHLSISYILL